jgi:hypothetical protein
MCPAPSPPPILLLPQLLPLSLLPQTIQLSGVAAAPLQSRLSLAVASMPLAAPPAAVVVVVVVVARHGYEDC